MTDAMARTFRPLQPLKGWRRVAVQAWRPPHDPSVYATLDAPMGPALAYLDRLRAATGVRVTVTHLVARGVALAIRHNPQLNGIVARGRILWPQPQCGPQKAARPIVLVARQRRIRARGKV